MLLVPLRQHSHTFIVKDKQTYLVYFNLSFKNIFSKINIYFEITLQTLAAPPVRSEQRESGEHWLYRVNK